MDPQACFDRYCAAVRAQDWQEARDACRDYGAWLARHGFPAKDAGDPVVAIVNDRGTYAVLVADDVRRREVVR